MLTDVISGGGVLTGVLSIGVGMLTDIGIMVRVARAVNMVDAVAVVISNVVSFIDLDIVTDLITNGLAVVMTALEVTLPAP